MGFDMYWRSRELTYDQEADLAMARVSWESAIKVRDQAHSADPSKRAMGTDRGTCSPEQELVWVASDNLSRAEVNYYRLNVWGMSRALDALIPAGAVHDKMDRGPDGWPEPGDFGLDEHPDLDEKVDGEWVKREPSAAEARYLAAIDAHLAAGVEYPGIPVHKLSSNDGWIVTPIECLSAAKTWTENRHKAVESGVDERSIALADGFMAWAVTAAEHDGFEVN